MILFFQRTLPHHRLSLFRELNKAQDVMLCFGKNGPANTYTTIVKPDFPHHKINDFYPFSGKENLVIQDVITPLIKFKPKIIILEFTLLILSNWFLFFLKPFFRYKIILHGHGWNKKREFNPEVYLVDKFRLWLMNISDAIVVYSQEAKKVLEGYLKKPEKIFVAHNTLDSDRLIKLRQKYENIGKENIKKELGFNAKYNLIYVGRVLKDKEPDRLIDVFKIVCSELDSVKLHIVGDGPLLRELKNKDDISGIKFWGSITDDEKVGKLIFASDLMVIPGYLGLSVVHAFCFDLPIVSQKKGKKGPFHSPEVEYVEEGKTGFLVEYGNNHLMAKTIVNYLVSAKQKEYMKQQIRQSLNNECSFSMMIGGFIEAIDYLKRPKCNS